MIHETVTAYLFLLPFLIFFLGFVVYPMVMCIITSFFDATMGREDIFVGFGLVYLKHCTDILTYVDVGDIDGENLECRSCVKTLAKH